MERVLTAVCRFCRKEFKTSLYKDHLMTNHLREEALTTKAGIKVFFCLTCETSMLEFRMEDHKNYCINAKFESLQQKKFKHSKGGYKESSGSSIRTLSGGKVSPR